jgi:hypothetical protein
VTRRVHDLADDLRTFCTGSSCASGAEKRRHPGRVASRANRPRPARGPDPKQGTAPDHPTGTLHGRRQAGFIPSG